VDQEEKTCCNDGIFGEFESGSSQAELAKNTTAKKTEKQTPKKTKFEEGRITLSLK
jgi:hypothetical protein